MVARMLSDLTASMRFKGTLNMDLNEVATTLVPFPRMHFLTTRCVGGRGRRQQQQQRVAAPLTPAAPHHARTRKPPRAA